MQDQTSGIPQLDGPVAEILSRGVWVADGVFLSARKDAAGKTMIFLSVENGGQLRIEPDKWGIDIYNSVAPWLKTAVGFENDQEPLADKDTPDPPVWVSIDNFFDGDLTALATAKADKDSFELETEPALGTPGWRDDRAYFTHDAR
jgi:hypothetical protein